MKRLLLFGAAGFVLAFFAITRGQSPSTPSAGAAPAAHFAFRITFGETGERETDYSGSVSLSDGRVLELIPWRFFGNDRTDGSTSWTIHTRRANMETQPDQPRPISSPGQNQNIVPKGVTAVVDAPSNATITIKTARAEYSF